MKTSLNGNFHIFTFRYDLNVTKIDRIFIPVYVYPSGYRMKKVPLRSSFLVHSKSRINSIWTTQIIRFVCTRLRQSFPPLLLFRYFDRFNSLHIVSVNQGINLVLNHLLKTDYFPSRIGFFYGIVEHSGSQAKMEVLIRLMNCLIIFVSWCSWNYQDEVLEVAIDAAQYLRNTDSLLMKET